MSYISANYTSNPRLQKIAGTTISLSDGGFNIVDADYVKLKNVRGQITFEIYVDDDPASVVSSFNVVGGFGEWMHKNTQYWRAVTDDNVNCTVEQPEENKIIVTTGPSGVIRQYEFVFSLSTSFPPKVRQTSLNFIGPANLTITSTKYRVIA